jgi:hypothetical protein
MDATCVGAAFAVIPGMMTFWPTKILSGEPMPFAWTIACAVTL